MVMGIGAGKRIVAAFCVLCCAAMAGCGEKSNRGTVSGNVTLDGQPIASGTIRFVPSDGGTATSEAMIADGKYSVSVPAGEKRVSISSSKVVGKRKAYDTPESPTMDIVQEAVPARYNAQSELKLTVQAGSQQKDFELTSEK